MSGETTTRPEPQPEKVMRISVEFDVLIHGPRVGSLSAEDLQTEINLLLKDYKAGRYPFPVEVLLEGVLGVVRTSLDLKLGFHEGKHTGQYTMGDGRAVVEQRFPPET